MSDIGFIGLGQMGQPMASQLLTSNAKLTVYDVAESATAPLAVRGARVADSAADLARECSMISLMVRDDDQVNDLITGPDGLLAAAAPGTCIVIHSTIRDTTAETLAEKAAEYDVDIVDAPVSGGAVGAANGSLAIMVGASEHAFARCRPWLDCLAGELMHAGPPGAGTRAKLARNLLHFAAFTAVAEAQRLAEAAGLDLTALGRIVRHSDSVTGGPGAIMLRSSTAPLSPDDDWYPIMTNVCSLGTKDLGLALELGRRLGVRLPMAGYAYDHLPEALGVARTEED